MSQPESTTAATLPGAGVELEPPAAFPTRHIGPDAGRDRRHAEGARARLARRAHGPDRARRDPAEAAARAAGAGRARSRRSPSSRAWRAKNRVLRSFIGMGYYDCHTPAGDPAQRAREPGLVHAVHALPGRDRAGPARGAAQLPDDGRRPHRAAARQRLAARRGDRRRRGDDALPRARQARAGRLLRRGGLPPADDRGR